MKLVFLALTSLAAVVGMAVPARADGNDDAFLVSLHAARFTAIAANVYCPQTLSATSGKPAA